MSAARGTAVSAPRAAGVIAYRPPGHPTRWATACAWIDGYLLDHRYAPSVRELADELGLSSSQSAWFALHRMRKAGLVDWLATTTGATCPRTLHVTPAGRRLIGGHARELVERHLQEAAGRLEGA